MTACISKVCMLLSLELTSPPSSQAASQQLLLVPILNLPWHFLLLPPSGSPPLPIILSVLASNLSLILPPSFRSPSEQQGGGLIQIYKWRLHFQPWVEKTMPNEVFWKVVQCRLWRWEVESMDTDTQKELDGSNWKLNVKLEEKSLTVAQQYEEQRREGGLLCQRKWLLISHFHSGPPVLFSAFLWDSWFLKLKL